MENWIGQTVGNYKIIEKTDEKDKYHHTLYIGEYVFCGFRKLVVPAQEKNKVFAKRCSHFGAITNLPVAEWNNKKELNHRLCSIYHGIKDRCYNKNCKSFSSYGGKGIGMCEDWLKNPMDFYEWSIYNGYDNDLTIDRLDHSKGYSPENCRWVTKEENCKRISSCINLEVSGITHSLSEWSRLLGFHRNYIGKKMKQHGKEWVVNKILNYLSSEVEN